MTSYDWIIGITLMFSLAMVLNYMTFKSTEGFFVFLTFFNIFVVYADLLPMWSVILNIIILSFVMYNQFNRKRVEI